MSPDASNQTATVNAGGALLVVLAVWAAIYLPGLGALEIKGEEGRRILPAVAMLKTGNYLVPQVGSEPYFRKPPLINWLVAASFKLTGAKNEWTARLPSVLCVLAVALAFVTIGRRALGANGSLIAALIWMTNFGMIEKGRLIEIEALYVSLTGLAFICWLSWWQERRSPWLTWTVPWIFLGLGMLAKGPVHLVFFYAVVLAILWREKKLRALFYPRALHRRFCSCSGFSRPGRFPVCWRCGRATSRGVWAQQFSGRLTGEDFKFSGWILNIPRGLGYFLPWTVLIFFGRRDARLRMEKGVPSGLLWGIAISFLAVSLIPGSLARYTMPLLVPAAWLAALLLRERQRLVFVTTRRHLRGHADLRIRGCSLFLRRARERCETSPHRSTPPSRRAFRCMRSIRIISRRSSMCAIRLCISPASPMRRRTRAFSRAAGGRSGGPAARA